MFGTLRFLLALMVMLSHTWTELTLWAGPYAVFGFFLLSGYLMTRVLDRSYASSGGTSRFFVNRALRIYPAYLAVLTLSVALLLLIPDVARELNASLVMPATALDWLRNLLIFTLQIDEPPLPLLIPPAWSVDVELCLYLVIGLFVRTNVPLTIVGVAASAVYTGFLIVEGAPFDERYSNVLAAGLPFGMGALIYHGRAVVSSALGRRQRTHLFVAGSIFTLNAIAPATDLRGWAFHWGFYLSLAAIAFLVMVLAQLDPRRAAPSMARTDTFLGSLSYPLFLCHWPVSVVTIWLGLATDKGAALFLWTLPLAIAVSWAVHRWIERPVEMVRDRVRGVAR